MNTGIQYCLAVYRGKMPIGLQKEVELVNNGKSLICPYNRQPTCLHDFCEKIYRTEFTPDCPLMIWVYSGPTGRDYWKEPVAKINVDQVQFMVDNRFEASKLVTAVLTLVRALDSAVEKEEEEPEELSIQLVDDFCHKNYEPKSVTGQAIKEAHWLKEAGYGKVAERMIASVSNWVNSMENRDLTLEFPDYQMRNKTKPSKM